MVIFLTDLQLQPATITMRGVIYTMRRWESGTWEPDMVGCGFFNDLEEIVLCSCSSPPMREELTRSTKFITGSVLSALIKAHPTLSVIALVRWADQRRSSA